MDKPYVSIVVLNWNGIEILEECLESLNNQNYGNCEILVVDNGSNDNSWKIVKNFKKFKLIRLRKNFGFILGNLAGVLKAKGDYILLINNDVFAPKDFLEKLVSGALKTNADMISPIIYFYPKNSRRVWYGGGKISFIRGRTKVYHWGTVINTIKDVKPQITDYVSGCSLLFKRDILNTVGFMDSTYFAYFEESDWCLRAKKKGKRLVFYPYSELWHNVSFTWSKMKERRYYLFKRNNFRFILLNYPFFGILSSISFIFFISLLDISRREYSTSYYKLLAKAILWNMKRFPETIRLRRSNNVGKIKYNF